MTLVLLVLIEAIETIRDVPFKVKNWIQVRVRKNHKKYKIDGKIDSFKAVAIFVIYPGTTPLPSIERIIDSLRMANFSVILVLNNNPEYSKIDLSTWEKNCLILSRANIGADFGGYKAALEYLEQTGNYKKIKSLVLINDSIYVTPNSKKSLDKILDSKSSINCIFLHRQTIKHAASMFLKFEESTIQSQTFRNFWKSYFPYSNKRQVIRNGEHRLSKIVGLDIFKPYVDIDSIRNVKNKTFLPSEAFQVIEWSERTSNTAGRFIRAKISEKDYSEVFSYSVFNLQISNSIGLYLNRVLNVPLKMDLVKHGLVSISEFLERASKSGVPKGEVSELRQILEKRGSHLTVSRLRSLLHS
jgi:hypothetical protein